MVRRGLAGGRDDAKRLIADGIVSVDGSSLVKPATLVAEASSIALVESRPQWASRGALKLQHAIDTFGIDVTGARALDVGASTGGFTDCLLQHGAARVIAVDVGYGQLDWKLRTDSRVHVVERTNARYMEKSVLPEDLPTLPDLVTMDLSFISVTKVLPAVGDLCAGETEALILVKPQFECGPAQVGSGGVVRRAEDRRAAAHAVAAGSIALGWSLAAAVPSPLRGAAGNWECFLHLVRPRDPSQRENIDRILDSMEVPDDHDHHLD